MTEAAERIRSQLSSLSPEDRAELTQFLLELDDGEDTDAETALDVVLARRAEEIKSGKVVGIPAEQVLAKLREKYP
jgi:putative addiction module component (TIGR02574 family)